jgi:ribosome-associated toxin RatA of RatAB toxin-antitoxin module
MIKLESAGVDFLARATARSVAEREMAVSAEQLFSDLEDADFWSEFFPVIRHVQWTSPRPFGPGTTRTVTLVGGMKLEEVFWTWEPGRRMGFAITASTTRALKGLVETYDITPVAEHRCKLRWQMAMELNPPLRFIERYMGASLLRTQMRLLKRCERVARRWTPKSGPSTPR